MSQTTYPQPLAQMERVEQSLISEKLDEMLDRIDKEDVGFVITEGGADKYVLSHTDGSSLHSMMTSAA